MNTKGAANPLWRAAVLKEVKWKMRIGKLEERLAMEKDPQVRKQLQALIEQRKRKRKQFWKRFEIPEQPKQTPEEARREQEQARREQRERNAMFDRGVIGFAIGGVLTCLLAWRQGLTSDDLVPVCLIGFWVSCLFALVMARAGTATVIVFAIGGVVTCLVVWGLRLTGGDLIFACFFGFVFSCMFIFMFLSS